MKKQIGSIQRRSLLTLMLGLLVVAGQGAGYAGAGILSRQTIQNPSSLKEESVSSQVVNTIEQIRRMGPEERQRTAERFGTSVDHIASLGMLPILNAEMDQRIENGDLEIGISIQGLGDEAEMANVAEDYRNRPGTIFKKALYLDAVILPLGIHSDSTIPGILPVAKHILRDLAPHPMSETDIAAGKVRVHVIALESGGGNRAGALTLNAANKGEVLLYGRTLVEQGIEQVKALAYGLPPGEYFMVVPSDNVLLPSVDTSRQYHPDRKFYLYTKGISVIGPDQNLKTLLQACQLGQMLVGQEGRVKAFVEKPNLFQLIQAVVSNAIGNAYPDESERKLMMTTIIEQIREGLGDDKAALKEYLEVQGPRSPESVLIPFVTSQEVWSFSDGGNKEMHGAVLSMPNVSPALKEIGKQLWDQVAVQAAQVLQEDPRLQREIKEIFDQGGRKTYANTFYFTIERGVMRELVRLWDQPTEKGNGSFWARTLHEGERMAPGMPDWSGQVLTPAALDLTKDEWMADYIRRGVEKLAQEKNVSVEEFLRRHEDIPGIEEVRQAAERTTTYTTADWERIYDMAAQIRTVAGGALVAVDFGPIWADVGSPDQLRETLRLGTQGEDMVTRYIYEGLFGEYPASPADEVNSLIKGDVHYEGNHRIKHSVIVVPKGVKLVVGQNVRIEGSYLELKPEAGKKEIRIPDGTIITGSEIEGVFRGTAEGVYLSEIRSRQGIELKEGVMATLFTKDGMHTMEWPMSRAVGGTRGEMVTGTPYTLGELLTDISAVSPKIISRDLIRSERRRLRERIYQQLNSGGRTAEEDRVGVSL